jgi:hypothetical protein
MRFKRRAAGLLAGLAVCAATTGCGATTTADANDPAASARPATPATAPESATDDDSAPTVDRIPQDERIVEASGMTVSGRDADVLLIHNDSGDDANLYRVGPDGQNWGRIRLRDTEPRDWEAAARLGTGDNSRVFIGDIGDNRSSWPTISVLEFDEPTGRGDATVTPTVYRFEFEDGPRDAESLMVSPRTGRLYVVSKRAMGAAVYLAPERLRTDEVNVLRRWRSAPPLTTDGAFSPDGSRYALRSYTSVTVYDAATGTPTEIDIPLQRQGESLTWTQDGTAVLIGSEGERQKIYRVPVPR